MKKLNKWRLKISLMLFSTLLCVVLAETASRLFWRSCCGLGFFETSTILYAYYPPLRHIDAELPRHNDHFYDILILSGSVLHSEFSQVEQQLLDRLTLEGRRRVRIFNLSKPAHTSRDSLLKYQAIGGARFDLVVFYHGINDARTNNAPDEIFRADYSHITWYEIINDLAAYHGSANLALPYTTRLLVKRARQFAAQDRYITTHSPNEAWLRHGAKIRSRESFKSNLKQILDLGKRRGDQMLMSTFAIHIPTNYSIDDFKKKTLDYDQHLHPVELWGRADDVAAAVSAHNDVVRELAASYPEVLFVDEDRLMPRGAKYFNSPCHFTTAGTAVFLENLLRVILPAMKNSDG